MTLDAAEYLTQWISHDLIKSQFYRVSGFHWRFRGVTSSPPAAPTPPLVSHPFPHLQPLAATSPSNLPPVSDYHNLHHMTTSRSASAPPLRPRPQRIIALWLRLLSTLRPPPIPRDRPFSEGTSRGWSRARSLLASPAEFASACPSPLQGSCGCTDPNSARSALLWGSILVPRGLEFSSRSRFRAFLGAVGMFSVVLEFGGFAVLF
ncbi:hypothetical protein NL676_009656 [Syzygium grande]|nr:hypothetical protein NL676_009656 [Syzygium grande]